MTTKNSSVHALRTQAGKIALAMKAAERGETMPNDPLGKVAKARIHEKFKVAIAMDDKILVIDMPWDEIRDTSETHLAEFVFRLMREEKAVQ